ncbi:MAG TPA: glycosyltransferase family 1 protein [Terracidiphilus sp.]|nr:glycosyltransferase family 1 protein [Terracidiphilus sp.]
MRILLVANYEPDGQQSMRRYAEWLERVLRERGHCLAIARPQPFFSRLSRHSGLGKYLGYLDKFVLFPPRLRRMARAQDIVHVVDHSNSMYLRAVRGLPNLITCHDVLAIRSARGDFPDHPTSWSGRLLQKWILAGLRHARRIVCVSAKTAADLRALTGETGATVGVIPNPLTWNYSPVDRIPVSLLDRLGLNPGEPYLLHIGGNQWYKNRAGAVRIFAQLIGHSEFDSAKLVFAGKRWTPELRAAVREAGLAGQVIEAGELSNKDLQALLSHAVALLYPSLEEGFGWPIIEAQACGCPVITTCRPPMSEVAGDAAILIDPADPAAAVDAIAAGLQHRDQLRSAGFRNVERYRESSIARQYCDLYEEIALAASLAAPAAGS